MENHASVDAIDRVAASASSMAVDAPSGRLEPQPRFGRRQGFALAAVGVVALVATFYLTRPPVAATPSGIEGVRSEPPRPAQAAGADRPEAAASDPALARKVAGLARDGRWNVLAVYAAEWVRREPRNADAWHYLGIGLAKQGRYEEAGSAVGRSAELAPERPDVWRTLGEIDAARERPQQALAAFERAAGLDARDVASRVGAGALYVELGQLARARETFAAALAIEPKDIDALCGAAAVAAKDRRASDEEALLQRVRAQGRRCTRATSGYGTPATVEGARAANRAASQR